VLVVLDEVSELALLLVPRRGLEGNGLLGDPANVREAVERDLERRRELLVGRVAAERLRELALRARHAVDRLDHVHRHADRAGLVGDAARDRLADPPGGVGGELEATAPVELLDGAHEADVAFLDQIEEEHAAPDVAARNGDHETQVGLDQVAASGGVAALDALRERNLLLGREQRNTADLAKVLAHRVGLAMAHVHVDRGTSDRHLGLSLFGLDRVLGLVLDYMETVCPEPVVVVVEEVLFFGRIERMGVGIGSRCHQEVRERSRARACRCASSCCSSRVMSSS